MQNLVDEEGEHSTTHDFDDVRSEKRFSKLRIRVSKTSPEGCNR